MWMATKVEKYIVKWHTKPYELIILDMWFIFYVDYFSYVMHN